MRTDLFVTKLNRCNRHSWPDSRDNTWKKMEISFLKVKEVSIYHGANLRKNMLSQQTLQWKTALRWWARAISLSTLGKNIWSDRPQLIQKKPNISQQQESKRAVFIVDKQLHQVRQSAGWVTVCPWVNQRNANVCLPEWPRPVWRSIRGSAQRKSTKTEQGTNKYISYYHPPRG